MTKTQHDTNKATSAKVGSLENMIASLTNCFLSMQKKGIEIGSISNRGNSFWGVMKLISEQGPLTVPQIATHRKLSRQRVQTMMDEYVKEGFFSFQENPHHKRSKLLVLTAKGQQTLEKLSQTIADQLIQTAQFFSEEEIQTTNKVLNQLNTIINDTKA